MGTVRRSSTAKRILGAAGATAVLVLAPLGTGIAMAATPSTGVGAADASAPPQCQLFTPLEGGIEQFEQAFDASFPQPIFTGQADIAQQMATQSSCPIGPPFSGAPSGGGVPSGAPGGLPSGPPSGGSSGGPQCALFDPVTGGLQQVESAFDTNSGQGAFAGSNDVAAAIDSGAGCTGTKPLAAPAPSGGSSGGPQCALFDPVTSGIQQVESAWDSGSNMTTFTGSNDVAAAIDSGAGCTGTKPLGSAATSPGGGNPSPNNSNNNSGNGGSGNGNQSGSGDSGNGSGGGATSDSGAVTTSASTGSGSGSLAFTGEPSWIPLAGVIALALAALSGLLAIGLRLAGRLLV